MKQISFKNFRKFKDFPMMDFAPITIFVGENNAGKSTVVKAILSTLEFLNSQYFMENDKEVLNHQFYFNKSYFAHVGTFARALYNRAEDDIITFTITESFAKFQIEIIGDRKDEEAISGKIKKIIITILEFNIEMSFDFEKDDICVTFHSEPNSLFDVEKNGNNLKDYFKSVPENAELHTSISGRSPLIGGLFIDWLIDRCMFHIESALPNEAKEMPYKKKTDVIVKGMSEKMISFLKNNVFFRYRFSRFSYIRSNAVEYIYAHAVTQTIIYSAKDTNDYFVKTIHEFANCRIQKGTNIHQFIIKWMNAFNVGNDYDIQSVGGEAHIVKIFSKDGSQVNLADKGMGSIQLMILLFRLATKMHEKMKPTRRNTITIIVEEPEQNLHPMLQSRLADLFYELNQQYKFNFIIETHSEYLIRKSQVIVSENYNTEEKLKNNPFKIYYFPTDGIPYNVAYRTNGRFETEFGQGFFDEAANLSFKLF